MHKRTKVIAVFGSAQAEQGSLAYEEARQIGALLAQEGFTVCSGGYGGVMEAVSWGARENNGFVIGVTTDLFGNRPANPWLNQEVRKATLLERLQTMVEMSQAYLALKGGIGTLTEVSVVWSLIQTRSIPPKPFVLLSDPWQGLLDFCTTSLIIRQPDFKYLQLASTPAEVVQILVQALRTGVSKV